MSRRRPRVPGMRSSRPLFVLPSIPDDAPEALKDGLAVRNAASVAARCPVCGAEPELVVDGAGIYHLVFRHGDECPATRDDEVAGAALDAKTVAAIVTRLRAAGCICDPPEIELVERIGDVGRVRAFHGLGCPLCPPEYREHPTEGGRR